MDAFPTVSVVINTDGRAAILANTLASLKYLRYPRFEVVVVPGPTRDGTHEMLAARSHEIKVGYCPDRNISRSRNIAVEIASGDLIAFLDDDEIPEPEWLDDLVPALVADPSVGVATGPLLDHTGKSFQCRYETVTRFGAADARDRPTPEFNFPLSFNVPHAMINSPFRRSAIVDIGGFDEEFEYYLDETDLICRMVDRGWRVAQLDCGLVHHKFLSNATRNERRVQTSWYTIIKNRAYFALMQAGPFATMSQIFDEIEIYVATLRQNVEIEIADGVLTPGDRERFEREASEAMRDGVTYGLRGTRRLADPARLAGSRDGFLPFPTHLPAARQRCFVLLSRDFPPAAAGGIARYVEHLARAIAAQGHHVHVLTCGQEDDRVDFEAGVWVHRIVVRESSPISGDAGLPPRLVWNHSMTMLAEAAEIAARRPIDCVHAPLWNAEAIAFLRDGRWPVVVSAHAALPLYLEANPQLRADRAFMRDVAEPMLSLERELLTGSTGIVFHSRASIAAVESAHGLHLDRDRVALVPHGLSDEGGLAAEPPPPLPEGMRRLLFVGRLEAGKGIDLLLRVAGGLMPQEPLLWLDVIGGDAAFYRASLPRGAALSPRIVFHGRIEADRLRGFYRAADIVVAPSASDPCPLVPIEAMMFGKPIIACRSGGTPELVEDGHTGLLVPPGDEAALRAAIERLLREPELRQRLGGAARARYLERFTEAQMARAETEFLLRAAGQGAGEMATGVRLAAVAS